MYNEIQYDLVVLDLPNIIHVDGKGGAEPVKLHPFMQPLIVRLAKARPNWKFFSNRARFENGQRYAVDFEVFYGGEELGRISREYNYNMAYYYYTITNKRIADKRIRGSTINTKDAKKAFKIVTKEFYGKTTNELVMEAHRMLTSTLSRATASAATAFNYADYAVGTPMRLFALDNWDAFEPFAKAQGAPHDIVDSYRDRKKHMEDMESLNRASSDRILVVLRGDDYIMQRGSGGAEAVILSNEDLTPHMRRCIGLLKLAEVDACIPGVGAKAADNMMFILPEPEGDTTSE